MITLMMKQWIWGDYEVGDKVIIFDSGADGGYKCKMCADQMEKRWDSLVKHLKRNHKMPHHRIKKTSLKIPVIKEK